MQKIELYLMLTTLCALTSESLATNHAQRTTELKFAVPSLVVDQLSGYAQIFIRAIGTDISQPSADLAVATYVDGA